MSLNKFRNLGSVCFERLHFVYVAFGFINFFLRNSTCLNCCKEHRAEVLLAPPFPHSDQTDWGATLLDKQGASAGCSFGRKDSLQMPEQSELTFCLGTPSWTQSSASGRKGVADDLDLSPLMSNSLGATSFSSRFSTPRRFLARHRTAMVSSTLANVTRPSTLLLSWR